MFSRRVAKEADLVLDLDNIEGARVLLDVHESTDTASVTSLGDHNHDTDLELDMLGDLARRNVDLDSVVCVDIWVWVTDVPCIVGDDVGDVLLCLCDSADAAQFVLLLSVLQAVEHEAPFGVVEQAELIVRCLELQHVHEAAREVRVSAHAPVDLDVALHADHGGGLLAGKGVLEPVTQAQDDGQALAHLVGARGRAGCPHAAHFVKHPVLGGVERFKCFFGPRAIVGGIKG